MEATEGSKRHQDAKGKPGGKNLCSKERIATPHALNGSVPHSMMRLPALRNDMNISQTAHANPMRQHHLVWWDVD
eukprot:1474220-Pleurochrysis_carterae.AAC.1